MKTSEFLKPLHRPVAAVTLAAAGMVALTGCPETNGGKSTVYETHNGEPVSIEQGEPFYSKPDFLKKCGEATKAFRMEPDLTARPEGLPNLVFYGGKARDLPLTFGKVHCEGTAWVAPDN